MKAVLGFLFVLSGLTVGYLVLSGKLPNASATTTTATPTVGATTTPVPGHTIGGPQSPMNSGGPMGMTTLQALNDMNASRGGMS